MRVDVNGSWLDVDVVGEGTRVAVCLPGMGDLRSSYRHLAPMLVAAGWRVATVDLRGHGASGLGFDRYDPEAVAGDLPALLDALGVRSAVVVANSAAAASAVVFASEKPDRVDGLVLLGPVARDPEGGIAAAFSAALRVLARAFFLPPWGAWLWGRFYRSLFRGGAPADHEVHVGAVVAALGDVRRRRAMLENGLSSKAASAARLASVHAPTLVVMGASDPDFPDAPREARELGALLRARVEVLPGVGHYPHQEVPDVLGPLVLGFLGGEIACPAA